MKRLIKRLKEAASLRRRFIAICIFAFIIVALLGSWFSMLLEQWLSITVTVPSFVWAIAFSILFGLLITNFITTAYFDPITKLADSMKTVANGNFKVEAHTDSRISDVREIYDSFNLMVSELSANEMLQSDFISNVSHEFKTPINAIEGYASLLQDSSQSDEVRQGYIEKILFNTGRLSNLAGNILLLSKLSNQSIMPQRTVFRLDEQVRQSILALESKWEPKEIEFDVELDEISYCGFDQLLAHVWTNLIDNAVKFDPHGGFVGLRLRKTGEGIVFTVDDNGPGISRSEREHIFNKFYRSDSQRATEGNGLGLALVKQIVELSGGSVEVQPSPNGGTRFTVTLPTI